MAFKRVVVGLFVALTLTVGLVLKTKMNTENQGRAVASEVQTSLPSSK